MCSSMWVAPAVASVSSRLPLPTKTPTQAVAPGLLSVTTLMPFGRVVISVLQERGRSVESVSQRSSSYVKSKAMQQHLVAAAPAEVDTATPGSGVVMETPSSPAEANIDEMMDRDPCGARALRENHVIPSLREEAQKRRAFCTCGRCDRVGGLSLLRLMNRKKYFDFRHRASPLCTALLHLRSKYTVRYLSLS